MKKICIFTSTRADYGILKNLIKKIDEEKSFKLITIVGGSHFFKKFGSTYNEIKKDKIKIDFKIKNIILGDNSTHISKIFSHTLIKSNLILRQTKPDLLVVLGDRYEILASVISANLNRIPVAHINGGEVTTGVLDDSFRHCITKLSHIHFTANETYKNRIIQLGENKKNIYNIGGLAADNIYNFNFLKKNFLEKELKLKLKKKNYIVTFHPETISKDKTSKYLNIMLKAFKKFDDTNFIFTAPGLELEHNIIFKTLKKTIKQEKNIFFFKSLGQNFFFSLLKYCDGMIGNSSSGILEMPYFRKPTINIGDRQKGRLMSNLIINCSFKTKSIISSIKKIDDKNFVKKDFINYPYGKRGAIKKIISILKNIELKELFKKKFIDIKTLYKY